MLTVRSKVYFPVLLALLLVGSPALAADSGASGSHIVVAKATGDAVVLWDATEFLEGLVAKKTSKEEMLVSIEASAGRVLLDKAAALTDAATITVKVIYAKIGEISPVYKTTTFTDFERLLSLKAARSTALTNLHAWMPLLDKQRIPPELTVTVTGQLPK